jgi:hypothetical protein
VSARGRPNDAVASVLEILGAKLRAVRRFVKILRALFLLRWEKGTRAVVDGEEWRIRT